MLIKCEKCGLTRRYETSIGLMEPNHFDGKCIICHNHEQNIARYIQEIARFNEALGKQLIKFYVDSHNN